MIQRTIPHGSEQIPVIGLGTWQTFDVGKSERERAPLVEVLRRFADAGGRVIDSSPMYGHAEEVAGDLISNVPHPFVATKVWTRGRERGIEQIKRSAALGDANRLDADPQPSRLADASSNAALLEVGRTHSLHRHHSLHDERIR